MGSDEKLVRLVNSLDHGMACGLKHRNFFSIDHLARALSNSLQASEQV